MSADHTQWSNPAQVHETVLTAGGKRRSRYQDRCHPIVYFFPGLSRYVSGSGFRDADLLLVPARFSRPGIPIELDRYKLRGAGRVGHRGRVSS